MIKRITIKWLFVLCTLGLAIASCTDTSPFFDNFSNKTENEKVISCIDNAMRYVQKNEENILFMKARGYKDSDLKYGLSRRLNYQGQVMLQIPVIKGNLTSVNVGDALTGQPTRAYALFVFDQRGRVSVVDYVEQLPSAEYRDVHDGELFYSDFHGIQDEYNEQGNYLGYYNVKKSATRIAVDTEDTIPDDSSIIDGGDLPGAEIVAPYPPNPNDPFAGGDASLDSLASTSGEECPVCGHDLEFDSNNGEYYCPSCGYGCDPGLNGGGGSSYLPGNGQSFDASKAIAYIKSIAYPYYMKDKCGRCAWAVRQAL